MEIRTNILIITLNINGLNAPTKRHRLTEWIQKQDLYWDFPGSPVVKALHFHSKGHRFDPWSGN